MQPPSHFPTRRSCRGVTLIELLVVISIIAMLVAILLPSLAAARARAKQIKCLAQQKQYHLGLSLYALDNKQWYGIIRYSRPWQLFHDSGVAARWNEYLGGPSYDNPNGLALNRLLVCPDSKPKFVKSWAYIAGRINNDFINTSYFLPGARGTYPDNGTSRNYYGWQGLWPNPAPDDISAPVPNERYVNGTFPGITMALQVGPPGKHPVIIDGYGPNGYWGNDIMSEHFNSHPSSTNMVFVDGHGEMRQNDQIIARHRGIHW